MQRLLILALVLFLNVSGSLRAAPEDSLQTIEGPITIRPIKHASLVLEFGGKVIYVDPWSEGNFTGLLKADIILITDIHLDHMDVDKIKEVRKPATFIVAPEAVVQTVTDASILRHGETRNLFGIRIEAIPMYNLVRGPSPGTLWHDKGRGNGYILTLGGKRIYISGDTECIPEMKALKNIDVAFVTMNIPYTMTPAEAAECVKAFRPKVVYPYHYGESDLKSFADALKSENGIEVRQRNWY